MMRVFLVEDEPPALRKLERMAGAEPDLQICGSASTCADAIAGVQGTKPQLAILDIRLPDGTGFEILQALEEPGDLQVIFLTAYDEYAVQAFSVAAIDYLLKPVSQDAFPKRLAGFENVWRLRRGWPRRNMHGGFWWNDVKPLTFFQSIRFTISPRIATTRCCIATWENSRCEVPWTHWKSGWTRLSLRGSAGGPLCGSRR
jgi:CheY-like chemotaxis protein